MQAITIRNSTGTLQTPGGAYLMMCIGKVKADSYDFENALEIYREALRIRSRTGTVDTKAGKYLQACIRETESDLIVSRMVSTLLTHADTLGTPGEIPVTVRER